MKYDPKSLGLPDLDAVRGAALYLPADVARQLALAIAELEAAREVVWHMLTVRGSRGVAEYGLPPWAKDPTIRGLLVPEGESVALDSLLAAYRRCSAVAAPAPAPAPRPAGKRAVHFAMPVEPYVAPLPRSMATTALAAPAAKTALGS